MSNPQPDDDEEQHVLVVGDTDDSVNKATFLIEKVLYSDVETRNKIREEQLKASNELRSEQYYGQDNPLAQPIAEHLMTPYGPPDRSVSIY
jgi:hypothetical protein